MRSFCRGPPLLPNAWQLHLFNFVLHGVVMELPIQTVSASETLTVCLPLDVSVLSCCWAGHARMIENLPLSIQRSSSTGTSPSEIRNHTWPVRFMFAGFLMKVRALTIRTCTVRLITGRSAGVS